MPLRTSCRRPRTFTRAAEIVARRAVAGGAAAVEIEAIRARGVVQAAAQRAASSGKRVP